ncbi:amino acid permease [Solitalea koreensis]|uniref:Amino acid/polyamine/organocation transporter, APC superfamily n=1 Tax=Solitalea koreensis TaxID=543615 RepID=A0A521D2G1_9SPHI|nr:amino acid permease [Solitalea koreensis]SMO65080.1 amino acid/polyamine/organocation transporter, APC superfamily [Solitalea koreensis]
MFNNLFRKKSVQNILAEAAKGESDGHGGDASLTRTLTVRDLTAFGIAAIIGAGIFSTIGKAASDGGPGVIFLFIFTAIACSFAAFAYAEFASLVPVSGSAYTYSYVAFGELTAWIIGWALIMEYAIGNITVAISWSDYFTGLLSSINIPSLGITGIHVPDWMCTDYLTISKGYKDAVALMNSGKSFTNLDPALQMAYKAWNDAPQLLGLHLIADIPALVIIILITWLVYRGMKESRNASNAMVVIKLAIILLVISVGIFYVDTNKWNPFAPNGVSGILKGVSAVFFAYIGFDAISTTAEECKDPQRDLPRGMMWAIIICTILYVVIALVLTGMVSYKELAVGDPLAFVFQKLNLKWLSGIIGISAIVAMASVLLVFQMGQPRIWMSMSRDGLLPKQFSKIHPKFKTPSFATIITGFVVAIPSLFMNLTIVTDLCSIGTLFAFTLVCAGVLRLSILPNAPKGKFKTPYINSKYIIPFLAVFFIVTSFVYNKENTMSFLKNEPKMYDATTFVTSLNQSELITVKQLAAEHKNRGEDMEHYLTNLDSSEYKAFIDAAQIDPTKKYESGWSLFKHKIPLWIFFLISLVTLYYCIKYSLSLIPVLGFLSCLYMMSELGVSNWIGFTIWLLIGLMIYFSYGYANSKLAKKVSEDLG